eukprot:GDKI01048455.1.p1 GENE.GDKI01048455.1~~GDKI01048455.1.p1  ORF type:complete len:397 (-),score=86.65 GDKI01048455.1:217-1407(-)
MCADKRSPNKQRAHLRTEESLQLEQRALAQHKSELMACRSYGYSNAKQLEKVCDTRKQAGRLLEYIGLMDKHVKTIAERSEKDKREAEWYADEDSDTDSLLEYKCDQIQEVAYVAVVRTPKHLPLADSGVFPPDAHSTTSPPHTAAVSKRTQPKSILSVNRDSSTPGQTSKRAATPSSLRFAGVHTMGDSSVSDRWADMAPSVRQRTLSLVGLPDGPTTMYRKMGGNVLHLPVDASPISPPSTAGTIPFPFSTWRTDFSPDSRGLPTLNLGESFINLTALVEGTLDKAGDYAETKSEKTNPSPQLLQPQQRYSTTPTLAEQVSQRDEDQEEAQLEKEVGVLLDDLAKSGGIVAKREESKRLAGRIQRLGEWRRQTNSQYVKRILDVRKVAIMRAEE